MWGTNNITRIIVWLCGLVLGLGAVAFPVGYYFLSYQYTAGSLEAEAELNARAITQIISHDPRMWEFEQVRLNECLSRRPQKPYDDIRRVRNIKGETVAEKLAEVPSPVMTRSYALYDAGVRVGQLEIVRSLRPNVQRACVIALFSITGSLVAYFALFSLPLRGLRKVEGALRDSEETHRRLIAAANDAIVIVDNRNGTILHANMKAEALTEIPVTELVGSPESAIYPSDTPLLPPVTRQTEPAKRVSTNHELFVLSRSGRRTPVEVSESLLELKGRTVVFKILRDISERKQAEDEKRKFQERLERMEKMESLGLLAGGVAHDLNNMLGPLVAYPELVLMKLPEDSPVRSQVTKIGLAAQQAADVVQDLLTLARRGRYEMMPLILNEVVTLQIDSPAFEKLSSSHPNVAIETHLTDPLYPILGSSVHLSKVVANLLANAFDAMPRGGMLTIRTRNLNLSQLSDGFMIPRPGPFVSLSVRDTGIGINPKDKPKIFEPYYSTKKMGASGSGLGLSVVYGVVKDHGGFCDVISTPNQGTEFELFFPVTEVDRKTEDREARDYRGSGHVLVVDDSLEQRELACDLLSSLGYTVASVPNGHAALGYLEQHATDIVAIDMIMEPGFDGLDTYREIIRRHPGQRAIMLTGFSSTDRVTAAQELGAGTLVMKPYTAETIGRALRRELERESPAASQSEFART